MVGLATLTVVGLRGDLNELVGADSSMAITGIGGPAIASKTAVRLAYPKPIVLLVVSTELIAATNAYRASLGLSALIYNGSLILASEGHSVDMATNLFLGHVGSDGSTLVQRVAAAGCLSTYVGENAAVGQPNVTAVLDAWIASPDHQVNLVNPIFDQIGVAGAVALNGNIYWTMDLGAWC